MSAHGHWGSGFVNEITKWNTLSRKLMRGDMLGPEDAKPLMDAARAQGALDAMSGEYEEIGDTDFTAHLAKSETKLISCCVTSADGSQDQEYSSRQACLLIRDAYREGWERRASAHVPS